MLKSFLLLLLISLCASTEGPQLPNDFIVTFLDYVLHHAQVLKLKEILGTTTGWEVIPRNNPAIAFPTDFVLLKIWTEEALAKLKASSSIKGTHLQRRYINVLNEFHEDFAFQNFVQPNMTGRHSWFELLSEDGGPKKRQAEEKALPDLLRANLLWKEGFTGAGIKIAIFDTGLRAKHHHFRNIKMATDWTDEATAEDLLGHGTFVAGVIASSSNECPGFAPDAELYSFRVFTTQKASYTTWFLDAFNHAIHLGINILNLSIGGPDFNDMPFVEKVLELSANNIIVVSAIGNDGPVYGSLNNPADQLDVIGVGAINYKNQMAHFSSRGMTTWELPGGYGRIKPDLVSFGQNIRGSAPQSGCKSLSGTSVASPVVAGVIGLLGSTLPRKKRETIFNPASVKQILIEATSKIPEANIFEQGMGKIDLLRSYQLLSTYTPHPSFLPPTLDLTDCPHMWPFCDQPIYYSAMPLAINVTILNALGVTGQIVGTPQWIYQANGEYLQVSFAYPDILWPWGGYLTVYLQVTPAAAKWSGTIEGLVRLSIESPGGPSDSGPRSASIDLPIKVEVIPTPPRAKRLLWDQFHSLGYPSGYFPRDSLKLTDRPFDLNGDHIHTNFRDFYQYLRGLGYFVEVLGKPFSCFDASLYGTLLMVDGEEEFFPLEITKLQNDMENKGLSVLVVPDWYNVKVIEKITFFDQNTKQWWTPLTGGSNVPAVNDFLEKYKIAFGDIVYDGEIRLGADRSYFGSGNGIAAFPMNGTLIPFELNDESQEMFTSSKSAHKVPLIGLFQIPRSNQSTDPGRIAVFGDSSCFDSATMLPKNGCFWLIRDLLQYTTRDVKTQEFTAYAPLTIDYISKRMSTPQRRQGSDLKLFSNVIDGTISCRVLDWSNTNTTHQDIVIQWKKEKPQTGTVFIEKSHQRGSRGPMVSSLTIPIFLLFSSFVLIFLVLQNNNIANTPISSPKLTQHARQFAV